MKKGTSTVDIIKKSKYYDILKEELDSQTLRSLIDIETQYNNTMKSLGITNALNLESFIEGIIEYLEDQLAFLVKTAFSKGNTIQSV